MHRERFLGYYEQFRNFLLFHLHGNAGGGRWGQVLKQSYTWREHQLFSGCLSFVFDRKRVCKNAAQGKDLKLLTSAVLGADAGRCHANSCIVKCFLLQLTQRWCGLLTARKKIPLCSLMAIMLPLYSLSIGVIAAGFLSVPVL